MDKLLNLSTRQILFLLGLLNILVYGQVIGFEFVSFDDAFYVDNVHVKNGLTWKGIAWAFSLKHNFAQFLNWISHMVDVEVFGRNPAGHHAVSLLLHIVNTALFFFVLNKLTGNRNLSAVAAILFAIHPLRVETVAWVADRKDLLAMFFALLSLDAYRRFTLNPSIQFYGLTLIAFLLALLSKPVMVVLPCVFLLIDVWPLQRLNRKADSPGINGAVLGQRLIEKIPFFVLIAVFLFMVMKGFEVRHIAGKSTGASLEVRLAMMPVLYMKYLIHTLWPAGLSVFYPVDNQMPPIWQWGGSLLVLLGITGSALVQWRRRPYLAVGWLWFVGSMLPMMGLTRIADHVMADRYTYFPLIGLFIAAVWGLAQCDIMKKTGGRAAVATCGILLLILVPVSFMQTRVWKNDFTLFPHALLVDPTNYLAHNNLGTAWMGKHQPEKAVPHLKEAARYCPRCIETRLNLGMSYKAMAKWSDSIAAFKEVLAIKDDLVIAHEELGTLYHIIEDGPRAIRHTRRALAIYAELFGPAFPKTAALRQQLQAYAIHYQIDPK